MPCCALHPAQPVSRPLWGGLRLRLHMQRSGELPRDAVHHTWHNVALHMTCAGDTPLMQAAVNGHIDCVYLLLNAHSDVNLATQACGMACQSSRWYYAYEVGATRAKRYYRLLWYGYHPN
jgi:hypothetical protein